MKTTKKVLSFVIALAFILSAFPMPVAFAEGEEYEVIALDTPVVVTATEENLGEKIFKFVAEKGGSHTFFSSDNDFDTYGEVYDKDMNLIAENDDGAGNLNFEIDFVAVAGETYYLKARGYTEQTSGGYSVVLEKMPGVESVSLDKENVAGQVFRTETLNLTAYPEDIDILSVEWVSNDENVVKIDSTYNSDMSAEIIFVGGGTTTVVATVDGYITATCTVTVEEPSYEQFMPEQTKVITATEDNLGEAIYKFVPEESGKYKFYSHDSDFDTYGHIYDSDLNQIYSDDDDGDGNNFYIEFDAVAGEVYYLKARPYSTETSGQYSVSVNKLISASSISLSIDSFSGKIGAICDIELTFVPENSIHEEITWATDDDTIVKISDDSNSGCRIMLIGTGTATVTATSEKGLTASCTINSDAPVEIEEGETVQLECSDNEYKETYMFVPQATGLYKFEENINGASYGLNLYNSDFQWIDSNSHMQVELTAGEKYYYTVNAEKVEDADAIEFSLIINHLVPATGISLSETEIKGLVATYQTITAQLLPENAIDEEITWTSSNEDAVVIYDTWDNGKTCEVRIVGKGSSVLTATSESGFTASCTVTADQIVDVTVGEAHIRYEDDGYEYTYVFEPEETGTYKFDFTCVNSYIDWIVMYDGSLSWLDKPSGDFQYEFTAGETYYFNPKAYVDYNQDEGDESYISLTVSKLVGAQTLTVSEESITDKVNTTHTLLGSFWPDNAITEGITWTSSDESVVKITGTYDNDTYCDILFVGGGTATITATSENGLTDSCAVTVKDAPEIKLGDNPLVESENDGYSRKDNWYKFVPEADGIYKFTVAGENIWDEYIYISNVGGDISKENNISVQISLNAGEAYYCEVYAGIEDSDYSSSATLRVEKMSNPTSIVLSKESLSASYLQYVLLSASFGPEGCGREDISWYSSDTSVAYIENVYDSGYCRVFLNGKGTATITVESESGLTDTCTITVGEPSEILLDESKNLPSQEGGLSAGSYKFIPEEDGTYAFYSFDNSGDTFGFVYDSEGNEIRYDDDGGDNNNFFAVFEAAAGEIYYLSARPHSTNGDCEYSVSVKRVIKATSLSFNEQSLTSRIGKVEKLYIMFGPEGAVAEDVYFTSSDDYVVEITNEFNDDEGAGCNISLLKPGTATITATTDSGLTATCTVTVEDIPVLTLGNTPLVINENGYYSSVDNFFKFIPEEDGTYKFTVSGVNTYDENIYLWNDELDEDGYPSLSHKLVAGQTYYVRAYADVDDISSESSAVITVEKLQAATSLIVKPEKTTGIISDEIMVDVVFGPQGCAVEGFDWEISDENVLDAVSGDDTFVNFFAIGAGEATVTFTSESGLTASCTITISEPAKISLDESKEISTEKNSGIEVFKFIPEEDGVYGFYSFDNNLDTYGYVYDSDVCEINSNDDGESNNNFLVQFEAVAGEVYYLKARPFDEDREGIYSVCVKKFVEPTVLRLSKMSYYGIVLDRLYLDATFAPTNAYEEEITWSSSDESVACVWDTYGKEIQVRLTGVGNAIITATTESGLKATCTITSAEPEEITLEKGKTVSFKDDHCSGVVKFVPEEDGVYRFDLSKVVEGGEVTLLSAEDTENNLDEIGPGEFNLTAGETYYCSYDFWDKNISESEVLSFGVSKRSKATSMTLSHATLSAIITEDFDLVAIFGPDGAASEYVEWTISDESVVEISDINTTSAAFSVIGIGTATITATSESGMEATCVVSCLDAPLLEVDTETELSFNADGGYGVYKFVPEATAAYRVFSTQSNLSYSHVSIINSDLEWLDDRSFRGTEFNIGFRAVAGNAYYILFTVDSYEDTTSCKFKVSQQTAATSLSLMADTLSGSKHAVYYCEYDFAPLNAAREEITWTSSNPAVVRVDNGYLYFDSIGVATVTAKTQSGLSDSVTVTVSEPPALELGVPKLLENTNYRDTAVHAFIPETSGYYTFSSSSDCDTYADLHDDGFNYITGNDDGGEGYNFRITSYLEEGKVYYLASRRYSSASSNYSLIVTKALDGDINDDGVVDVYDYQQLVNFTVLTDDDIEEEYGTETFTVADMNNDGTVDALDAWKLSLIINQHE